MSKYTSIPESMGGRPGKKGAKTNPRRLSIMERFGIERRSCGSAEIKLPTTLIEQIEGCKDDEARRILLGKSEQFTDEEIAANDAIRASIAREENRAIVKSVWKSAHAVQDFPGKATIRRFSPYKGVKIEGEGKTVEEAWRNTADKIRAIWSEEDKSKH